LEFKDYYKTLEVDKKASPEVIQRAYRKLARKFHPDVNQAAGTEDRFKEINEAYEVLKDAEKRKTYDRFGSAYKQAPGGGAPPPGWEGVHFDFAGGGGDRGASGFSSFFDSLFGGAMGGRGRAQGAPGGFRVDLSDLGNLGRQAPGAGRGTRGRARRGGDQEAQLVLSLEEAARGGQRELTLGDPMSGTSRTHKVNLPPGVRPGQRIRLPGRGMVGAGGQAGDLYLRIELKPHRRFRLEGKDLHTTVAVMPWEAALGGEVNVATLDGPVTVRVPPGTSSGRTIRIKDKGFPGGKKDRGDLYAKIRIAVPKTLSDEERQLFEQLAKVSSFRAR